MSRRVPELALAVGVLLSSSFVTFLAVVRVVQGPGADVDPVFVSFVAVALLYPFAAYAVRYSDDPTGVLPPRVVGGGGVLAGLVVLTLGALTRTGAFVGLLVGLLVAVPPLAYAVAYGRRRRPVDPDHALVGGAAGGVAVLAAGVLADARLVAAVAALLVFLPTVAYAERARRRSWRPTPRRKTATVGAAGVTATALLALGVGLSAAAAGVYAALAVIVGTVFVARGWYEVDGARPRGRR